jgi:hypothetical protein
VVTFRSKRGKRLRDTAGLAAELELSLRQAPVSEKTRRGMRKDQNLPQQRIIGRPFCGVCKAQMWLACIEPDKPDYDKRTFECPVCSNVTVKVVKYRTIHSLPTGMKLE